MGIKTKERSTSKTAASKEQNGHHSGALPTSDPIAPIISNEKLQQLYASMLKCRLVEERARLLCKEGRFTGNYPAAVGLEATVVGSTLDLRVEDSVVPSGSDFNVNLVKGTPLAVMFAQLYARSTSPDIGGAAPGQCGYAPLNVLAASPAGAEHLSLAAGVALACKMQKKDNVVLAFSGDGSGTSDLWYGALNLAAVHNLPIIYLVRSSVWAESAGVKLQGKVENLSIQAEGYGFPSITVDGNDVVAVYRVAHEAIHIARNGGGPTLIECKTLRWYEESEMDAAKHPTAEEVEYWKAKDPIPFMQRYLEKKGLWSEERKQSLQAELHREIEEAIAFAEGSPHPQPEECLDHVFSFSVRDRELSRKHYSPQTCSRKIEALPPLIGERT